MTFYFTLHGDVLGDVLGDGYGYDFGDSYGDVLGDSITQQNEEDQSLVRNLSDEFWDAEVDETALPGTE